MKNWILWMVVSLLFIGAATTFFILWYKEKKKTTPSNGGKTVGNSNEIPSGVQPAESVPVQTENVVTEVGGRTVGQVMPFTFGRTAN